MDNTFKIYTSRLYLAKMRVSDAPQAFKWCGDPEATKYLRFSTYTELTAMEKWIASIKDEWNHFGVFLSDGMLIGNVSCGLSCDGKPSELGYSFARAYWGHGYATESAKAILAYTAEHFDVRDFWVAHAVENVGSQRVIEKCGFKFEKTSEYSKFDDSQTFAAREYTMHVDLHRMNLNTEPFEKIVSGRKTVEMRLNDEKRRKLKVGDLIAFERIDNIACADSSHVEEPQPSCVENSLLVAKVVSLHAYSDFSALYAAEDLTKCGYTAEEVRADAARPEDMLRYYPAERQAQFGALAVELEVWAAY